MRKLILAVLCWGVLMLAPAQAPAMVRSVECGPTGIAIVGSNGNSYSITYAQMEVYYGECTGNAAARKACTIARIINEIVTAIGGDTITSANLGVDFDVSARRCTRLDIFYVVE